MRSRMLVLGFALGLVTALVSTGSLVAGPKEDDMMRLFRKYAMPGPYHDRLEIFEGEWDVTTKIWMDGPDSPPVESTAVAQNRLIFGGRFLETRAVGEITFEIDGKPEKFPTEAVGYVGYDNYKEKYVSIWIDGHATGIHTAEGTVDASGKVFTYFGISDDWETGTRNRPFKVVDRIIDEDTTVSEVHDLMMKDGQTLVYETTAKRRKPDPPATQPSGGGVGKTAKPAPDEVVPEGAAEH